MSIQTKDPKLLSDEDLINRVKTYTAMDTTVLMLDDQRFIANRLRALIEEIERRQEARNEMDS